MNSLLDVMASLVVLPGYLLSKAVIDKTHPWSGKSYGWYVKTATPLCVQMNLVIWGGLACIAALVYRVVV
jgi:hypothetical protein